MCVCSQLVEPCHSQLSSFHRQIFLRLSLSLQRTFDKSFFYYFTQGNSGRHSPAVDPERHPWKHHHERGGKIRLQQEEEDVASQREVDVEAIVPACEHRRDTVTLRGSTMWKLETQNLVNTIYILLIRSQFIFDNPPSTPELVMEFLKVLRLVHFGQRIVIHIMTLYTRTTSNKHHFQMIWRMQVPSWQYL